MTSQLATLGAGGAGFVPTQLAGLQLWLKGGAGTFQDTGLTTAAVADGDPVGGWQDQSGQGHNAIQGTAAAKGTLKLNVKNGKSVVRFDGVDDYLTSTFGAATPFHLFVVLSPSGGGASNVGSPVGFNDGNNRLGYATLNATFDVGGTSITPTTPSQNSWYVVAAKANGSSSKVRVNGADNVSGTVGSQTATSLVIGDDGSTAREFQGDIAELLWYSRALADTEVAQVESYLNGLYAVY
jgi:hypothetical protein